MYEPDDILILGDSFCKNRYNDKDWPKYLTNKLTGTNEVPRGKGYGGCSWWSIRNSLIKEFNLKVPKILIICHTEPNRVPSDYDFGINFTSAEFDKISILNKEYQDRYSKDILEAARMYYKYLHFYEFHQWAQTEWFLELDEILTEKKIPIVIHLHSFSSDKIFENGTTSKEILYLLTSEDSRITPWNSNSKISYYNHFTEEQNIKIGESLYKAIQEYDPNDRLKDLKLLG